MSKSSENEVIKSYLNIKNRIIFDESNDISANDYLLFLTVLEKGFLTDLNEKAITSSALAYFLGKSKPALTKQSKKLIKKGYLKKEKNDIDKRNRFIILTPLALDILYNNKILETANLLVEKLGEEDTNELIRLMTKIDAIFKEVDREKNHED